MFDSENKIDISSIQASAPADLSKLPVETMEKDLKNLENPNYKPEFYPETSEEEFKQKIVSNNLTAAQKSSPFLQENTLDAADKSDPLKKLEKIYPEKKNPFAQDRITVSANEGPNESQDFENNSLNLRRYLIIGAVTFLVLLSFAGGYYFIISNQSSTVDETEISNLPPTDTEKPIPPTSKEATELSSDKPNYLVVDPENSSIDSLSATLKKQAEAVGKTKNDLPFEFVVSDSNFNPVLLRNFADKFNLSLSSDLLIGLKDSFSLFIFQDGLSFSRIGLALDIKDEAKLRENMTKSEGILVDSFDSLFLGEKYEILNNSFSSGQYKEAAIRFQNLKSITPLSVDYSLYKGKLLIGTTKESMRGMIDYLDKNTK